MSSILMPPPAPQGNQHQCKAFIQMNSPSCSFVMPLYTHRSSILMPQPAPQGNQRQRKASIQLPSLSPSASNNALLDPPVAPSQPQHLQQQRSRRLSAVPIDPLQAFPHHGKEHLTKVGSRRLSAVPIDPLQAFPHHGKEHLTKVGHKIGGLWDHLLERAPDKGRQPQAVRCPHQLKPLQAFPHHGKELDEGRGWRKRGCGGLLGAPWHLAAIPAPCLGKST